MSSRAIESTLFKVNRLLSIDDSYKAPEKMMALILNPKTAKDLFLRFLTEFNYDLSYEWFNDYFADEHADRKNKKQDFTPTCLSRLIKIMCVGDSGIIYEPACGTGSTIIQHWYLSAKKVAPWKFNPMATLYFCEELSDKTIPFLLFNIMIRGMNAVVVHGDTLTRKAKNVFHCFNERNDPMGFSDLLVLPHSKRTEEMFNVEFADCEEAWNRRATDE